MSGICGQSSTDLSASGVLQQCLENRLRVRLHGSPECEVIWKPWTTPWGQSRFKPRAEVRASCEIGFGLWPMIHANCSTGAGTSGRMGGLNIQTMVVACWPANAARDWKNAKASQETLDRNSRPLNEIVLSTWSALRATDGEKGGPNQSFGAGGSPLPSQVYQTDKAAHGSSSSVQTENIGGSLHPEFAGWEMGFSPEWISCAPSGTQSMFL